MGMHEVDELSKVDEKVKWEAGEVTRYERLSKVQKVTCFVLCMVGIGLAQSLSKRERELP